MKKKFGIGFATVIVTLALLSAAYSNTSDDLVNDDLQVHARTWAIGDNLTENDDFSWVAATTESNANGIIKRHPQGVTPTTTVATVKLYRNREDTTWVGKIEVGRRSLIGSHRNEYYVEPDTGSRRLWVVSSECKEPGYINKYKPGLGNDLKKNFEFVYATHSILGQVYSDTVNVGGMKIKMSFGGMTTCLPEDLWTADAGDGVLGLSRFPAAYPERSHFFTLAKEKYPHFNPVVAFYFGTRDPELHLGGVKEVYVDKKIEYHPLIQLSKDKVGLWTIGDGEISLNGKKIATGIRTYFDTGALEVYGPLWEVMKLYKKIPNSNPFLSLTDGRVYYRFPCNHGINLSFKWGNGRTWPILPENLGHPLDAKKEWCKGVIVGWKLDYDENWETLWMYGSEFMHGFYLVFDYGGQQLGLAEAD